MTALHPSCVDQGYSTCGPDEYRDAEGTSFAAPQVSAAAATLLGVRPGLSAEQVTYVLERSAVDGKPSTGCSACPFGRDRYTGWGRLDVTAALQNLDTSLPVDKYESNDDAGKQAFPRWGVRRRIQATLDYWDDQDDVYSIRLRKGQRLFAGVLGPPSTDTNLVLWLPGTRAVEDFRHQDFRARESARPGPNEHLSYRATRSGTYYLQVKMATAGSGRYRLSVVKA